ncbi:PF05988 family protein [Bordetella bronchiseptica OSU553]|nr:PF05988 family protein [Bordetella bronchiseptica OSU553]
MQTSMEGHEVVSRQAWLERRRALLAREKAQTRLRDELAAQRRALPWVRVDKPYVFETARGRRTLADLFDGRSQLIVKHFMLGPGWGEGCVGCSFEVDHVEGALLHLRHHDVGYVAVSRAPLAEIEAFKRRMGWGFEWVSSYGDDFNFDYHVSFTPQDMARGRGQYNYAETELPIDELSGLSVFYRDAAGEVFHTYSAYGRGAEEVLGAYMLLDLTPKGRNETGPRHDLTDWVRHHDRYGAAGQVAATGRYEASGGQAPPDAAPGCCGAPHT